MLNQHRKVLQLIPAAVTISLALIVGVLVSVLPLAHAQEESTSHGLELGIIVTPTAEEAEAVIKEFKSGTDFGVLAKEKSIDSTADDGGYLGRLNPAQLQPALRDAANSIRTGQISAPFRMQNGFAVVTILSKCAHLLGCDTLQRGRRWFRGR
jgi:parvulin-like peptidyl-prolyl isomerase